MPAQLTAADYVPGSVITTPELLRDVLANEDGVFAFEQFMPIGIARIRSLSLALARIEGRLFRACLRCPKTAAEMRKDASEFNRTEPRR